MRTRSPSSFVDLDELATVEDHWTQQQVEVFQLTQLRRTIRIAETYCPFYKQRFSEHGVSYLDLHTAEDLAQFPILTQEDLKNHRDDLIINQANTSSWTKLRSNNQHHGSLQSKTARGTPPQQKEQVFIGQILRRTGKQPNDRTVLLGDEFDTTRVTSNRWTVDLRRKVLHFSNSDLTAETVDSYLNRIEKFRPHFIVGYPSALLMLALQQGIEDAQLQSHLKAIICTSERLENTQREFLEKTFKTRVLGRYVQPERVVLATQTDDSELYHFSPGYGYAELDTPGPSGKREVLGTSFHDDSMPLVRFRTGDIVADSPTGPEKRSFPWLAVPGFAGRTDEFLIDKFGKKIWPVQLSLDDSPFENIVSVQFFQDKPGLVTMRFTATRSLSKHERTLMRRRLSVALGKNIKIQVRQTPWLPKSADGRLPWVYNKIKKNTGSTRKQS